jgi:hypothetical protein
LKSFETKNKAEQQTNSTSYQALSGHFFQKNLYTYKKLRNKTVLYVETYWSFGDTIPVSTVARVPFLSSKFWYKILPALVAMLFC